MVGSFLATDDYREKNPEVIASFRKGLAATAEAVAADPDSFRAALPDLAKMTPEVAETMTLPVWKSDVDVDSLTFVEEQMRSQGVLAEPFDISTIVAE